MKKNIYLMFSLIVFVTFSCSKDDEVIVSNDSSATYTPEVVTGTLKFSGVLSPKPGESGTGNANVYLINNSTVLKFENFKITNGPDLRVYLSKTEGTESIVDLGGLKVSGDQSFIIPSNVVVADYKYVLIYCQQYNILFSSALLSAK